MSGTPKGALRNKPQGSFREYKSKNQKEAFITPKGGQAPVYLDGAPTDLASIYTGNSANADGWLKVSGNKEAVFVSLGDEGYIKFTFDKKGNGPVGYEGFLTVEVYNPEGYDAEIRWDCSKYYAYADIAVSGTYLIPQLMQDNGKIQSFDQVWIGVSAPEPDPVLFDITVFHRVVGTGAYLVYPGVGEFYSSTDEAYIEWLNDVNGFEFLNLYLAAIRDNDPASLSSVEGYVCSGVEATGGVGLFSITVFGAGENISALITPVADGSYEVTFWYVEA